MHGDDDADEALLADLRRIAALVDPAPAACMPAIGPICAVARSAPNHPGPTPNHGHAP
ncbi:hypothetical protein [Dactylosporangium salmoneum]|uniref:Uncharacterized protein n=1 Tax=Dactylosporangium salmoneum TaxID=53361 RepID=A0ABP5TIQ5_9ACTN